MTCSVKNEFGYKARSLINSTNSHMKSYPNVTYLSLDFHMKQSLVFMWVDYVQYLKIIFQGCDSQSVECNNCKFDPDGIGIFSSWDFTISDWDNR